METTLTITRIHFGDAAENIARKVSVFDTAEKAERHLDRVWNALVEIDKFKSIIDAEALLDEKGRNVIIFKFS